MAMLVLHENDVISRSRPVYACGAKNRSAPIELKFGMAKLSISPDTMTVWVLRENVVSDLWAWFYGLAQK